MKAKITKPDGTTIEIEGDAEDVRAVLREDAEPPAYVPVPYPVPQTVPRITEPGTGLPWWEQWTCDTGRHYTWSVTGPLVTNGSRGES